MVGTIEVENLTKSFGTFRAVDDITFEVYVSTHDGSAPEEMQTDLYLPIA